ncbi:MAG: hypothetical protein Kow0031_04050 [Anaerolineae bacterium]
MKQNELHPQLKRIQRIALMVGVVGLVGSLGGAFLSPSNFFQSYLLGYVFWLHIALGHMAILLIHHLAGGRWSFVPRRFFESGGMTVPVMALLFIPILIGMPYLYPWTDPEVVAESHLIQLKAVWWLNIPFFVGRTVLYFIIWIGLAYFLNKLSLKQDETGDPAIRDRLKSLSAGGIILAVLASTFAAYDWMMSTDPIWYSSMYGVIFMAGQALSAIATGIIITRYMSLRYEDVAEQATINIFNDLGNFLLAFTSFWAYVSFSQYLILWSSNLPETITWYMIRGSGGWQYVAILLIVFGFAIPFVILLSRRNKRNIKMLLTLAWLAMLMRFVDLFWIIIPTYYPEGFYFHWLNLVVPIGIGGVWIALYIRQLPGKSYVVLHDPRFELTHDDHAAHAGNPKLQEVAAHE